ncbi:MULTISPECIES: hypothetical protein [Rhizobium/Agrobacterium group]|uniref:Transposase n=1 Tax=Agrobacterium vitis TaxID=373 RepID=A0ABD6HBL3_AGRVI|nr:MULTISPECIES: hypothetical protein [Rhizobium/Agrobacterium group]MCF1448899.1 hypothetical protein [Allorhizobium ampelinum]MCF1492419.1 hypothetical protein [Allorhizobium ampelinum]MUO30243.1 hypothetical protein [Agrobacterium vitis]MUO45108.1 hypothetical protein [Agrobacterium vitis]MUP12004.1 hypothetical protein [Agrobacterium vitis]
MFVFTGQQRFLPVFPEKKRGYTRIFEQAFPAPDELVIFLKKPWRESVTYWLLQYQSILSSKRRIWRKADDVRCRDQDELDPSIDAGLLCRYTASGIAQQIGNITASCI